MNWLDIVILVFLAIAVIGGIKNGFIKSLFSLAGLIVGVVLAGRFYTTLAGYLTFIPDEKIASIVAFLIIFALVSLIAALLGMIFTRIASAIMLGWLNRLLGGVLGLVLGAISIAVVLVILMKFTGIGDFVSESFLASFLIDKLPLVLALLPKEFDVIEDFFK
ncbi:MAG TPA: CvpA family protein [Dehalococcoidales bacterium]|nr:CvpA family protein [Dehalococcoidales bacterium]